MFLTMKSKVKNVEGSRVLEVVGNIITGGMFVSMSLAAMTIAVSVAMHGIH